MPFDRPLPEPSGCYAEDCQKGRAFADHIISIIRTTGNPTILGLVGRQLIDRGTFEGVEAGFSQRLAECLISSGD
jgi:hypothetical protein